MDAVQLNSMWVSFGAKASNNCACVEVFNRQIVLNFTIVTTDQCVVGRDRERVRKTEIFLSTVVFFFFVQNVSRAFELCLCLP